MIQKQTCLIPADNCGVFIVKTFHLYGGSQKKIAITSEFIKASVRHVRKKFRKTSKIKKKLKTVGILIRSKRFIMRNDNSYFFFRKNNVILLKKRMTPRGKIIKGPIVWKIRRKKFRNSFPYII